MKIKILLTGLFCISALWFNSCRSTQRVMPETAQALSEEEEVRRGEIAFARSCERCHPQGGAGLGPSVLGIPGFALRRQVRNGFGAMPAFNRDELPKKDLDGIVAYLRALNRK